MGRLILKITFCLIMALTLTTFCFAIDTKTVVVTASIPQQNTLTVGVSKVVGTTWTPATSLDLGGLVFDSTNKIFTTAGSASYVVDVTVNSNSGSWTVTHKTASITNGTDNLDNNVSVIFQKQIDSANGTQLDKVSFANSNNKAYTNTQIGSGWLRVYYGLATGDVNKDAPGTTPIGATKASGSYQGSVTFTLTP